jgi:hypothetical protein
MGGSAGWSIAGSYLEACNCDAICPCRRIGGTAGGRSTYGVCMGALSWLVERGHLGELDLYGLSAVIACRYDDDEPGSPWTFFLYVDERGDARQRDALVGILTGRLGGSALEHFPWAWNIDHTPGRGWFRAGGRVEVRVRGPVEDQAPVTCVIPGHHRAGVEHRADLLRVDEAPLSYELSGRCAYESTFEYSSDDA